MGYSDLKNDNWKIGRLKKGKAYLERRIAELRADNPPLEGQLVRWAMKLTGKEPDEFVCHPVLQALVDARKKSILMNMGWNEAVARAVAKLELAKWGSSKEGEPMTPFPPSFDVQVNSKIGHLLLRLSGLKQDLSSAQKTFGLKKTYELDQARMRRDQRREEGSAPEKPILRGFPQTRNIAAQCGQRQAPVGSLLAIAHGLATGEHWWLLSPSTRKEWKERDGYTVPAPTSLDEVRQAHEERAKEDKMFPNVHFCDRDGGGEFVWVPLISGRHDVYCTPLSRQQMWITKVGFPTFAV